LAEAEHVSGEKMLQGLYSWDQTDWIIPPPIENGVIPKNAYGNIDLYVDSMLPQGAVHIPLRGTKKICNRLNIDFAEAVTGFEFGHRMAVPIITGVVIAEEHYDAVMDEWQRDEAERERKEDEKRTKAALTMWRKMLMGLRIVERFKGEYGEVGGEEDVLNPWINRKKARDGDPEDLEEKRKVMNERDEEMGGGFLPEGFDAEEPDQSHESSFFHVPQINEEDDQGGGFVVEDHSSEALKLVNGSQNFGVEFEFSKPGHVSEEDEDEDENLDTEESLPSPPPKKRGRLVGSAKETTRARPTTPASIKRKSSAKTALKKSTPAPTAIGKRKSLIQASKDDEVDEDESSLSELESQSDFEEMTYELPPNQAAKKTPAKRGGMKASLPKESRSVVTRKTPRRSAASGVRSRYFEHDDEEDDDE